MPLPPGDFTKLPGISNITDISMGEQLAENLISYFDWGLLSVGAFFNVKRPAARSKCYPVKVPNVPNGKIWETTKSNWVWESGIPYSHETIPISGIYVNNNFVPNGSGYYIDYPNGQIVFDVAKPSGTQVELNYSYKKYNFYDNDNDWFQQVIFDPMPESGVRDLLARNRINLPAVIVEVPPDTRFVPRQIGDYSVFEEQAVLFHVLAEHDEDRTKMVQVLKNMYQRAIWLYNTNDIANANMFPLTYEGRLSDSPLTYPALLNQFVWKRCEFIDIRPQDITSELPLYRAVVRTRLRFEMP